MLVTDRTAAGVRFWHHFTAFSLHHPFWPISNFSLPHHACSPLSLHSPFFTVSIHIPYSGLNITEAWLYKYYAAEAVAVLTLCVNLTDNQQDIMSLLRQAFPPTLNNSSRCEAATIKWSPKAIFKSLQQQLNGLGPTSQLKLHTALASAVCYSRLLQNTKCLFSQEQEPTFSTHFPFYPFFAPDNITAAGP